MFTYVRVTITTWMTESQLDSHNFLRQYRLHAGRISYRPNNCKSQTLMKPKARIEFNKFDVILILLNQFPFLFLLSSQVGSSAMIKHMLFRHLEIEQGQLAISFQVGHSCSGQFTRRLPDAGGLYFYYHLLTLLGNFSIFPQL